MKKPAISEEKLRGIAERYWTKVLLQAGAIPSFYIVAVAAYFRDSMGVPFKNDRNIYDDAFLVVGPNTFGAFNGNTDPSIYRNEVATLDCPQVVWYRPGQHRAGKPGGHHAFRQDSPVVVRRDNLIHPAGYRHASRGISLGGGRWTDSGYPERFWTNLHMGSRTTTSSLGCLTVHPDQWPEFRSLVLAELAKAKIERFPCILIPGPIN
jgi:hypothetical protein